MSNEPNPAEEWRPQPEDIERVARAICKARCVDADMQIYLYEPARLYGINAYVAQGEQVPAWHYFFVDAVAILHELHARPIGWKPETAEPELPLDPDNDDYEEPAPKLDLSAFSTPPGERQPDWFENMGLR